MNSSLVVCLGPSEDFMEDSIPQTNLPSPFSWALYAHLLQQRQLTAAAQSTSRFFFLRLSIFLIATTQNPEIYHNPLLPQQAIVLRVN